MTKNNSKKFTEEKIKEKVHEVAESAGKLLAKAKEKYNGADAKTKKRVLAGIAGAGAILAGVIGLRALRKKRKGK